MKTNLSTIIGGFAMCSHKQKDLSVPHKSVQSGNATGQCSTNWWQHLLAGGIAGAVSRTSTAPLDRLKVFLQVHGTKHSRVFTCMKQLLRQDGFCGMWRGNGVNVLKIAPEYALRFMVYEQSKQLIQGNSQRELSIHERFISGAFAGGISQSVVYPLEVLKTRLALRKTGEYTGIVDAAIKMYKKAGWKTFYRGYLPNLLGIIPYAGTDLAVYETLKNSYLRSQGENQMPSIFLLLGCGTISATCGQICSYPLSLVRTRLQAQVTTGTCNYSTMQIIKGIVQRDGLLGLYRGIIPNFLKVAPAVSISYIVYERCRCILGVSMT